MTEMVVHPFCPRVMPGRRWFVLATLVGALSLGGCMSSTPQRSEVMVAKAEVVAAPAQPEDEALSMLSTLDVGRSVELSNGTMVRADAAYYAASGRRCRFVDLSRAGGDADRRLACEQAQVWAWYPDVLP